MNMDRKSSHPSDAGIGQPSLHFLVPVVLTLLLVVSSLILLASCASQTSTRVTTQQTPTTPGKRMPTRTPTQVVTTSPTTLPNESIGSIQMIDPTTGWAVVARDQHILRTTDGGAFWKDVTPPYARSSQAVDDVEDFLSASLAWVAIAPENGTPPTQVYRTTDGGRTWQMSTVPTTSQLGQLTFLDPQHGWLLAGIQTAMGPKAVDVFRTSDGGKTWTKVSTASPTYWSPGALPPGAEWLAFADTSTGWATGYSPVSQFIWLYVTHDGGSTWRHHSLQRPAGAQGDLSTGPITFFNRQEGVLSTCFCSGADISTDIYVTHDGGATWNSTSLLPFSGVSDFLDSTHGWVLDTTFPPAATTSSLYLTSDGGAHWTKLSTSTNFHDVGALDFVSDTVGWAIGASTSDTSFLLKTTDGGRTWTEIPYSISSPVPM